MRTGLNEILSGAFNAARVGDLDAPETEPIALPVANDPEYEFRGGAD